MSKVISKEVRNPSANNVFYTEKRTVESVRDTETGMLTEQTVSTENRSREIGQGIHVGDHIIFAPQDFAPHAIMHHFHSDDFCRQAHAMFSTVFHDIIGTNIRYIGTTNDGNDRFNMELVFTDVGGNIGDGKIKNVVNKAIIDADDIRSADVMKKLNVMANRYNNNIYDINDETRQLLSDFFDEKLSYNSKNWNTIITSRTVAGDVISDPNYNRSSYRTFVIVTVPLNVVVRKMFGDMMPVGFKHVSDSEDEVMYRNAAYSIKYTGVCPGTGAIAMDVIQFDAQEVTAMYQKEHPMYTQNAGFPFYYSDVK